MGSQGAGRLYGGHGNEDSGCLLVLKFPRLWMSGLTFDIIRANRLRIKGISSQVIIATNLV